MSGEPPSQDSAGGDPTRRREAADPTQQVTRRSDPADASQAHTQRIPVEGSADPQEWTAADDTADADAEGPVVEGPAGPGRGRLVAVGLVGLLVGFVAAFLVVALGSSDVGEGEEVAARVEQLEGELAERDARIGELEDELAQRDTRIAELEAQVAEAEAAAGEQDADVAARQQALDERARALDERESALNERAAALDERAEAIESAERDPTVDLDDVGIDDEEAQNVVDRVVEAVRDLFR